MLHHRDHPLLLFFYLEQLLCDMPGDNDDDDDDDGDIGNALSTADNL